MPDREKVDEWARDFMAYVDELDIARDAYRGIMEYIEDALALLLEQEPVNPYVDARDGWYRCGKCGNSLASGERVRSFGTYKWPVYCEKCGRKVKWDG